MSEEMRLGKEINDELEKKNVVAFRNDNTCHRSKQGGIMRQPLSCVLDTNTKDMLKAWLGNFRHCDDIYVDIDGYRIEFATMDDRGHMQKMSMPSIYSERECRMWRIKDLLGEEEE